MKNIFLLLLILLTAGSAIYKANAQFIPSEWINISNQAGDDMYPDIFKAKDGSLHCVWVLKHSNEYQEIYYSKSTDKGETWSIPENITNRDSFVFSHPHIVADTQDHLYVTADSSMWGAGIVLITNNGNEWSDLFHLTDNGDENAIVISKDDRVYVFWNAFSPDVIKYRYFENGTWSNIIQPYDYDSGGYQYTTDSKNNIHILGSTYDGFYAYFKYNEITDTWLDYQCISSEDASEGLP